MLYKMLGIWELSKDYWRQVNISPVEIMARVFFLETVATSWLKFLISMAIKLGPLNQIDRAPGQKRFYILHRGLYYLFTRFGGAKSDVRSDDNLGQID